MIAFGPVPSRRLGRSLGINNIPPKGCTYSCVYCQVGRTLKMQVERRAFYDPEEILKEVRDKVERSREAGEAMDYLTFVPDGEPTLDVHLGREIELLKPLGIPIAVITNASLIGRGDVREELMKADWVSLKVDAVREEVWRRINQAHHALRLSSILDGMLEFAKAYNGELVTETMLVKGVNDSDALVGEVAHFLAR
ncbi:MAG: radical SAM protein, partial [Candidatus Latescibacterota bacterium]